MKIIHILHHSISPFVGQFPDKDPIHYDSGLPMKFARAIKKRCPEIDLFCWRPERTAAKEVNWKSSDGLSHRVFPSYYARFNLEISPQMLRAIKIAQLDPETAFFVHGSYNLHANILGPLLKTSPAILQSHGGFPAPVLARISRHYFLRMAFLPAIPLEKRTLVQFPCIYAISNEEVAYIRQHLPGAQVSFSPTGTDFNHFCPGDRLTARNQIGFSKNRKMALYVGRLAFEKGINFLIDAFSSVAANHSDTDLVIIGSGPLKNDIEKQINALGLSNRVKLVGHIGYSDLPMWYRAADVTVMPSLLEWFGSVAVESMACGVPVIATRAGGAVDIVNEFECGELVPPRDSEALAYALNKALLGDFRSQPNISRARQRFDWEFKLRHTIGFLEGKIVQKTQK